MQSKGAQSATANSEGKSFGARGDSSRLWGAVVWFIFGEIHVGYSVADFGGGIDDGDGAYLRLTVVGGAFFEVPQGGDDGGGVVEFGVDVVEPESGVFLGAAGDEAEADVVFADGVDTDDDALFFGGEVGDVIVGEEELIDQREVVGVPQVDPILEELVGVEFDDGRGGFDVGGVTLDGDAAGEED
ncbi:MAG: hypothetical protein GY869_11945 [Planctomycetes bacterium]|nr:hypothetical protein [Planctomycetota bacterium]